MAPAPIFKKPDRALVLLGHGSTVNPDSSAPTLLHADEIKRRGLFAEVACAFWKEEPSYRQVLDMVESPEVYIVPNFISEGYFTQKIIPRELGLAGSVTHLPPRPGLPARTLKYCEPVGNHPYMTELLLHRARETAPGIDPARASLVIVGHGTSLNENSGLAVKEQVARIQARGEYAEVLGMFMEEDPFVTDWQTQTASPDVIVVPFFVSDGLHSYQDIPVLLGIAAETGAALSASAGAEVFRRNPYSIGGRRLYYSSAIGTDPLFAGVILEQVQRFDARPAPDAPDARDAPNAPYPLPSRAA
jgi:sirohydrochlorin cobaltochelatase